MLFVSLGAIAHAQQMPPLPDPPVRAADHELDCTSKRPSPAGTAHDCDGVLLPPSYLAYLEDTRVYATQLHLHAVAQRAVAAADAKTAADAIAWRDQQLAVPRPVRMGEALALIGTGVGVTLAAGWALGQAAQ